MRGSISLMASCTLALVLAGTTAASAPVDALPLPEVDYEAQATTLGGTTLVSRHSGGIVRLEMIVPGVAQPVASIIDLRSRKMVTLMPIPGAGLTAIEVGMNEPEHGFVVGEGRRVGTANAAGEPCDIWEIEPSPGTRRPMRACLSADHIPLRIEAWRNGKYEAYFEVTELKRTAQDPKLFVVPPTVPSFRIQKGLRGSSGAPAR